MKKKSLILVIPVYNESQILHKSITLLIKFLKSHLTQINWQVVIANNASTDTTLKEAQLLSKRYENITVVNFKIKGRGHAVKTVWLQSTSDFVAYMDVDLSTALSHFPHLVEALNNGFDIAVGNRLLPGSKVYNRTLGREIMSRTYSFLVHVCLGTCFSDPQCGFKILKRSAAHTLLPLVINEHWFFDTELLMLAEKLSYRIYEEPVTWEDDQTSSVNTEKTIIEDLQGIIRLFITKPWNKIGKNTSINES